MLRIDFGQTFEDHRSILVLVKKLGSVKEDEFSQLFEDISQLRTVDLPDSRMVHLRYTRHISHQFVEWGSFHTHKKLLGILSIARCSPDKDLASIQTAHESLKTWYSNTSLDSRCFLLGYAAGKASEEELKKQMREFVFLKEEGLLEEIKRQVAEYALSLFLVLESKRMDKSLEKPDKMTLLHSPLDSDVPIDAETRNRKQCIGRMKKYIGDLCLVAGVPQEAIFHYSVAIYFLRSHGDALWLSGAMEGLCAASLLFRSGKSVSSLERPSLQLNVDQLSTAGPVNGAGSDGEDVRIGSALPLTDEEIAEKADEIFQVYGKHKESKVLGVEARFKYARFFVMKKLYKEASNVLQDVLSSELSLSDAEKIQQYSAMSIMYEDIGFTRKAAFFTRMAAINCTSQHLPLQGWTASYNLLRNALEGYKIYFDKQATEGITVGWPQLQIILMKELIKMSEELQCPEIPIRHISYLLHAMYKHMKDATILQLITSLDNLGKHQKHYTLVDNLVLANGEHLPPVFWTDFPVVRKLKVNVLASHLRPFVSPTSPLKTPFIFSMLNKKPRKHKKHSPIVNWVEGEVGEVAMQVLNPMPFDVKVNKMTLLTEGIQFQAFSSCLALSNDGMAHPFMLLGIPESPGQLRITGYSVELFGIQSNCPISKSILDNPLDVPLIVNVTPRLPLVQFQSSIPNIKSSVNSSHRGSALFLEVLVYTGQIISGPIVVENLGKIPVENLTSSILSTFGSEHGQIVELNEDFKNVLPLQPDSKTSFHLTFNGLLGPNDGDNFTWTGKIKVSYSGGAAWTEGMSRQAAIDIKVDILRSLHCSIVELSPLQSNEQHFQLLIDVQNQTTHDFEWRYEVNQETKCTNEEPSILPANEKTRACIVLEKLDLSNVEDERSECVRCAEILSELVTLNWRIPDLEVSGMLNIGPFQVDEETVNVLRKHSLTFEIRLNELSVEREEILTTQASSPVMLTVKATNCTDHEVKATILNIEPFEVDEDGVHVFEVKSKICWLGSTSTVLPNIDAGGSAEHTCGFLFLYPGKYFVNIRCFEKASVSDNVFRDRTHVIKNTGLPSNVHRTRNSRSESFTDSLLLRQRSFPTLLAMLAHSAVIRVVDDCTVTETVGETISETISEIVSKTVSETSCATHESDVKQKNIGEIQVVHEEIVDTDQYHRVDGDSKNSKNDSENSKNEHLILTQKDTAEDELVRNDVQCVEIDHCLEGKANEMSTKENGSMVATNSTKENDTLNESSNVKSATEDDGKLKECSNVKSATEVTGKLNEYQDVKSATEVDAKLKECSNVKSVTEVTGKLNEYQDVKSATEVDAKLKECSNVKSATEVTGKLNEYQDVKSATEVTGKLKEYQDVKSATEVDAKLKECLNVKSATEVTGKLKEYQDVKSATEVTGKLNEYQDVKSATEVDAKLKECSSVESATEVDGLEADRRIREGRRSEIDEEDDKNGCSETNAVGEGTLNESYEDTHEKYKEEVPGALRLDSNQDINDSPAGDTCESDGEIVRSRSVQERIMFFNTN